MRLEELKRLRVGGGEQVPTLQEAVEALRGRCLLFMEIKPAGIEGEVVNALREMEVAVDAVILGTLSIVARVRALDSSLKWCVPSFAFGNIRLGRLYAGITPDVVSRLHEKEFIIIPQTDNMKEMASLVEMGVDGILTDWPSALVRVAGTSKSARV